MKTIYLARHAKSSWKAGVTDFKRSLNHRGESDAIKIGHELLQRSWIPQKIISSSAIRAMQSCKVYCELIEYPEKDVDWQEDVYAANTINLLHLLSNLKESVNSVMLVGHNPSMEDLMIHLCGYSQVSKLQQFDGKILTTANVAKITTNSLWKDIVMDEMHLEKILRPKEL